MENLVVFSIIDSSIWCPGPIMDQQHIRNLQKLCRICGNKVQKYKNHNKRLQHSSDHAAAILAKYNIDTDSDEQHRHPPFICDLCYSNLYLPKHHALPNDWPPHPSKGDCKICNNIKELNKGGRPKKEKYSRLSNLCSQEKLVREEVEENFEILKGTTTPILGHNFLSDDNSFICKKCTNIFNRPVETTCEHITCLECLHDLFVTSSSTTVLCPSCKKQVCLKDIQPAKQYFLDILLNARVRCKTCNKNSWLKNADTHDCADPHTSAEVDEKLFKDIISTDISHLGKVGQQMTSGLLKKCFQDAGGKEAVAKLSTYGKAMYIQQVPSLKKTSTEVTQRTLQLRTKRVKQHLNHVTGSQPAVQLQHVLTSRTTKHELQDLLDKINMKIFIPPLQELAMKSDLGLSWSALRELKLWLRQFNVFMASEQTSRNLGNSSVGQDMLDGEILPFLGRVNNALVIKPAPCVYIRDLKKYIMDLLDENERCGKLKWNEGQPYDEVWLKLGGDKGGGSFKFMIEIANLDNPNSRHNTSVVCAFAASDLAVNLHMALDRYKTQVEDIANTRWREKKLVLFLFGDYEFLCRMYGMSGPSGRHSCLWCTICSKKMILPRIQQVDCVPRTTETLQHDHALFVASLHISLGVWYKMYTMMEDECRVLGERIASELSSSPESATEIGNGPFSQHVAMLVEVTSAKTRVQEIKTQMSDLQEQIAVVALLNENINITEVASAIASEFKELEDELLRQEATANNSKIKLQSEHNPLLARLDRSLEEIKVRRQAYYSNTFIGNHVNKCVKETNINKITTAIVEETAKICPTLVERAESVAAKYAQLFKLFASCHNVCNRADSLNVAEIEKLEKDIKEFLEFFRVRFPDKTFPPKMHILEAHVIPFIRSTNHGLGLLGEQGGESMHAIFNCLTNISS